MKNIERNELAVCGFEAVKALAAKRPEAVQRLFFTEAKAKAFGQLCSIMAAKKRLYRIVSQDELIKLSGTAHHQGVVAMIPLEKPKQVDDNIIDNWQKTGKKIVVLDKVGDDHNLGSIARSAVFFGWDAIVVSREEGYTAFTTSSYRVARGALEHINIYSDDSAARFLARCNGKIPGFGADPKGKVELAKLRPENSAMAIVLGNEETGLSKEAKELCRVLVKIKGSNKIDSLNVSQAAAVLLYKLSENKV